MTAPATVTPRPVRSLDELLGSQADAALAVGRADRSCWNGRIDWLPRPESRHPEEVVGIADWDGTICLSRASVLRPLARLFTEDPASLSLRRLLEAKLAVSILLHENNHLLVSGDQEHADTEKAWSWPMVVLEEGVTEAFTHAHLDEYIERLGLDVVAPRLRTVAITPTYPAYVPAVEALAHGVGRLTGRPSDDVLRGLNAQSGAAKYGHLGGLVLEDSGLAGRIPAAERPAAAEYLVEGVRDALARVGEVASPDVEDVERHAKRVGRDAVAAIVRGLQSLDEALPPAPAVSGRHVRARSRAARRDERAVAV